MFWLKKKDVNGVVYGTFNERIFATIIDLMLLIVILSPLEGMIFSVIYSGSMTPSQELNLIIARKVEAFGNATPSFSDFANIYSQSLDELKKTREIWALFLEKFMDLFILLGLIMFFWIKKQATPGKMLLSLKIVDEKTLGEPSIFQYIMRMFGYFLSCLPFGLGLVNVALNKRKRAWHDFLAGTVVIKVKKEKKIADEK